MVDNCFISGCPKTAEYGCTCDQSKKMCEKHISEHLKLGDEHKFFPLDQELTLKKYGSGSDKSKNSEEGTSNDSITKNLLNIIQEIITKQQILAELINTGKLKDEIVEDIQDLGLLAVNIKIKAKRDPVKRTGRKKTPRRKKSSEKEYYEDKSLKKELVSINEVLVKSNEVLQGALNDIILKDETGRIDALKKNIEENSEAVINLKGEIETVKKEFSSFNLEEFQENIRSSVNQTHQNTSYLQEMKNEFNNKLGTMDYFVKGLQNEIEVLRNENYRKLESEVEFLRNENNKIKDLPFIVAELQNQVESLKKESKNEEILNFVAYLKNDIESVRKENNKDEINGVVTALKNEIYEVKQNTSVLALDQISREIQRITFENNEILEKMKEINENFSEHWKDNHQIKVTQNNHNENMKNLNEASEFFNNKIEAINQKIRDIESSFLCSENEKQAALLPEPPQLVRDDENEERKQKHPEEELIREQERIKAEEEKKKADEEKKKADEEKKRADEAKKKAEEEKKRAEEEKKKSVMASAGLFEETQKMSKTERYNYLKSKGVNFYWNEGDIYQISVTKDGEFVFYCKT